MVIFRLPFTATVEVTPSRAALPPKKFTTLPRAPASWNLVFWSERTSALSACVSSSAQHAASTRAVRERNMTTSGRNSTPARVGARLARTRPIAKVSSRRAGAQVSVNVTNPTRSYAAPPIEGPTSSPSAQATLYSAVGDTERLDARRGGGVGHVRQRRVIIVATVTVKSALMTSALWKLSMRASTGSTHAMPTRPIEHEPAATRPVGDAAERRMQRSGHDRAGAKHQADARRTQADLLVEEQRQCRLEHRKRACAEHHRGDPDHDGANPKQVAQTHVLTDRHVRGRRHPQKANRTGRRQRRDEEIRHLRSARLVRSIHRVTDRS